MQIPAEPDRQLVPILSTLAFKSGNKQIRRSTGHVRFEISIAVSRRVGERVAVVVAHARFGTQVASGLFHGWVRDLMS